MFFFLNNFTKSSIRLNTKLQNKQKKIKQIFFDNYVTYRDMECEIFKKSGFSTNFSKMSIRLHRKLQNKQKNLNKFFR